MIVIDYRQLLEKIDNPPYTLYSAGNRAAWLDECIATAHAFDAEPVKHAEWIFQNRHDEDGRCIYHCSECNFETKVFPCNLIPWQMHEKYCARCGAQMDGDSND